MTNFNIGDKVISKVSGNLYTVCPVPQRHKCADWAKQDSSVWIQNRHGDETMVYKKDLSYVHIIIEGQDFIQKVVPGYGECWVPYKPEASDPPVGSLWRGIKGGRYVVINTEGDAFDFNSQKIYKLPKTAEFVALKAEDITVNHKDGQL